MTSVGNRLRGEILETPDAWGSSDTTDRFTQPARVALVLPAPASAIPYRRSGTPPAAGRRHLLFPRTGGCHLTWGQLV